MQDPRYKIQDARSGMQEKAALFFLYLAPWTLCLAPTLYLIGQLAF